MRQTIELLKKQSIQAGLTSAHIESMGVKVNGDGSPSKKSTSNINGSVESGLHHNGNGLMQRQLSTDSVCSINSLSSNCSTQDKKKKKGWVSNQAWGYFRDNLTQNVLSFPQLRSSFSKAFTRNAKITKTSRQASLNGNLSDSKASLPPPTPQHKALPKMPTVNNTSSDLGKPPISPTKTHNRQVTLIDNGKNIKPVSISKIFKLKPLQPNPSTRSRSKTTRLWRS
jgi:neuron navigator 2